MTTGILAKLGLSSWDQASAWATGLIYPCERCMEYDRADKCEYYEVCKLGSETPGTFFTRTPRRKAAEEKPKPYRPDPRRGSVRG